MQLELKPAPRWRSVINYEILPAPVSCLHHCTFPHNTLTCLVPKQFTSALEICHCLVLFGAVSSSLSGLTQHAWCGLTDISQHFGYRNGEVWVHPFMWYQLSSGLERRKYLVDKWGLEALLLMLTIRAMTSQIKLCLESEIHQYRHHK